MSIVTTRPATAEEWDEAWDRDATATFFQSRAWAEVWREATEGRMQPAATRVDLTDGTSLIAPVTLDRRAGGLVSIARMSPADTWGGPLLLAGTRSPGASNATIALHRNLRWIVSPWPGWELGTVRPAITGRTMVTRLDRPTAELRASWRGSHPSSVKKALRAGVRIDLATTEDDWRGYFDAYEDSLRRWGDRTSSRYPWRLFAALQARRDARIRLWLAILDGRVVAGALCLAGQRIVSYWHGAAVASDMSVRPVNLLLETAILDAQDRGYEGFDLGPSGGHEGVEKFKRTFAPDALPFLVIEKETSVLGTLRWGRRAIRRGHALATESRESAPQHGDQD